MLATATGSLLGRMARLLLLKAAPSLREEAAALTKLSRHIQDLQKFYRERSTAFARQLLERASLTGDVSAVEAMETDDGVIVRFVFPSDK